MCSMRMESSDKGGHKLRLLHHYSPENKPHTHTHIHSSASDKAIPSFIVHPHEEKKTCYQAHVGGCIKQKEKHVCRRAGFSKNKPIHPAAGSTWPPATPSETKPLLPRAGRWQEWYSGVGVGALLYSNGQMESKLWPGARKHTHIQGLLWVKIHRCRSFDIQKKKEKKNIGEVICLLMGGGGREKERQG